MLEGAGLFEADVEVVVGVGDEDPDLFLLFLFLRFGFRLGGGGGDGFAVEEVVEGGVAVGWCCCWGCGGGWRGRDFGFFLFLVNCCGFWGREACR